MLVRWKFIGGTAAMLLLSASILPAQNAAPAETEKNGAVKGSLIEDRSAKKLIEAGDARYEADEPVKSVELWQSVIERYPRSRHRFEAQMRLGDYYLDRERAYDRARTYFEMVAAEDNRDEAQRASATLKIGICFYEARNFGKSFSVMRNVIEQFPVSPEVNQAYYYIGLGHFQLGHYSRAIEALEKVGTALNEEDDQVEKLEAGKRFFIRIEDADLAALEAGKSVKVLVKTTHGDEEQADCYPVGRNVRIVLGSIPTQLGKPESGNKILEVTGDDVIHVEYLDQHTADKQMDRPRLKEVHVVGNAVVTINDGAYQELLRGVVLGKQMHVQVVDADLDLTSDAERLIAALEVYRAKTDAEIEAEQIQNATNTAAGKAAPATGTEDPLAIDKFKLVDRLELVLSEAAVERSAVVIAPLPQAGEGGSANKPTTEKTPAAEAQPAADPNVFHSGVFRSSVNLVASPDVDPNDDVLQALPGDAIRVVYLDQKNTGRAERTTRFEARAIEGNLGGVRVTRAQITDEELRIRTKLRTADALTNIGNRYKEFGLKSNSQAKYEQALQVCEEIMLEAGKLGGRLLEETYVQLWKIYFEMDRLELAAALAERLQREFPQSGFVDDALLQLGDVARKQGDLTRAVGIYARLVNMKDSQLRGEAQFGVAQCYEKMGDDAETANNASGAAQLYDRAFQEYKRVYDNFPDSGRVGEAVAQMANYYYKQQDYARAVDTFETVLSNHPDARFLDVILFNYGRCLYRMNRRAEARQRFDQLIQDYPESPLAADAKKISDALAKAGSP